MLKSSKNNMIDENPMSGIADAAVFVIFDGNYKVPEVTPHIFLAERDEAFSGAQTTGIIPLCRKQALSTPWAASTPTMLGRYVIVRKGESFSHHLRCTSEVYYVIRGEGFTRCGSTTIPWACGDTFVLAGGLEVIHQASEAAIILQVTNEPELCYLRSIPDPEVASGIAPIRFSSADLSAALGALEAADGDAASKAVMMINRRLEATLGTTPTLSVAFNTLEPGADQAPHRHSAAALTLGLATEGVYSMVGGKRVEWGDGAVMLTPPNAMHSHHNRGAHRMRSLVVQDGALHAHLRTRNLAFE